jgi:hypothetical protein
MTTTKLTNPTEVLYKWMDSVNKGDVNALLSVYDDNAVLIPTFSNRLLKGKDALRGYFEKLGSKEDLSIALHEKTIILQDIGDNLHAISGIYNWRFSVDGELLNFEARFDYLLDLKKNSPILHHHSSQIPRAL